MTGGCRQCSNAAKASAQTPPPEVVEQKTREALEKDPTPLSTICGVRVAGLEDLKLTVVKAGHASQVRVEGKPVLEDAGVEEDDGEDEDEDDAGNADAGKRDAGAAGAAVIVTDTKKLLACVGVVVIALAVELDHDGNAKGWKTVTVAVDSVETPGVHFDKTKPETHTPETHAPRHTPRRHHHHHH